MVATQGARDVHRRGGNAVTRASDWRGAVPVQRRSADLERRSRGKGRILNGSDPPVLLTARRRPLAAGL